MEEAKKKLETPSILGADLAKGPLSKEFFAERQALFQELYQKQQENFEKLPRKPIKISLPNGEIIEGTSYESTPLAIAKKISNSLADAAVVARVVYKNKVAEDASASVFDPDAGLDGNEEENASENKKSELIDLTRPLEGDCELQLLKFDSPEGQHAYWHSSAHVLGAALEQFLDHCFLTHGPPIKQGFFYDSFTGNRAIHPEELKDIEKKAKEIISKKSPFRRLVLNKDQALELFKYNPFKVHLIKNKVPDGSMTSAYSCGNLIDLCMGPHIRSTGAVKAIKLTKNSSSYWLSKATNDSLQRVYGVSFPSKDRLAKYVEFQEQAAARDHRNLGKHQGLFDFNILSPGSPFFFPDGANLYNNLIYLMRNEYRVRGYQEVQSPNIYNIRLFKMSGHYINYKDDMFMFKMLEKNGFGIKPMNCPGHCLMFDNQVRSYRDMPIRFADFGVLHRNEISGALTGLTRVRRFQQDDAHLFCMESQIQQEVLGCLQFLDYIYGVFGFEYSLALSTRPKKYLGAIELWDKAEENLKKALDTFGKKWKINKGDGAFYGPKIDIQLVDALERQHQCGTVQVDFQLPIRFNLQYRTSDVAHHEEESEGSVSEVSGESQLFKKDEFDEEDFVWKEGKLRPGFARPVIIHRAILGSVERFMAILIEHCAGKWPFWLSPRQIIICPLSEKFLDFAKKVYLRFHQQGFRVAVEESNLTLKKKIRNSQLIGWNYIFVVGEQEEELRAVDVRTRDNKRLGKIKISQMMRYLKLEQNPPESEAHKNYYSDSFFDPEEKEELEKIRARADAEQQEFKKIIEEAKVIQHDEDEGKKGKGEKKEKKKPKKEEKEEVEKSQASQKIEVEAEINNS